MREAVSVRFTPPHVNQNPAKPQIPLQNFHESDSRTPTNQKLSNPRIRLQFTPNQPPDFPWIRLQGFHESHSIEPTNHNLEKPWIKLQKPASDSRIPPNPSFENPQIRLLHPPGVHSGGIPEFETRVNLLKVPTSPTPKLHGVNSRGGGSSNHTPIIPYQRGLFPERVWTFESFLF